ncbi:MAG: T9SS type A sorting domain-containing protein [Chitinophagaceae bacterium]
MLLALPFTQLRAQCGTQIFTYTATGDGNTPSTFTIPQYNDGGVNYLTSINITVRATIAYNAFAIENSTASAKSSTVRPFYSASLSSPSITSSPGDLDYAQYTPTIGPYTLAASDGNPGAGADFRAVSAGNLTNNTFMTADIYDAIDLFNFTGTGNVSFSYTPDLSSYSVTTGVNFVNGTTLVLSDIVTVTVTYSYCPLTTLASDLSLFTAIKRSNEQVDLHWVQQTERADRTYTVQKSNDGNNFTDLKSVKATPGSNSVGDYNYTYNPSSGETGKLYFRIKQTEYNGETKYSSVRIVEIGTAGTSTTKTMTIYPNPTQKAASLVFGTQPGNWNVDIVALSGQVIRKLQFRNASKADLNTDGSLPSGVYFLKIVNQQTQELHTQRLVVQ